VRGGGYGYRHKPPRRSSFSSAARYIGGGGTGLQPGRHKLGGTGEIGLRLGLDVGKRMNRDSMDRTCSRVSTGKEDTRMRVTTSEDSGITTEAQDQRTGMMIIVGLGLRSDINKGTGNSQQA